MSIITFPLEVFSGASCYLVALIILLRCLALLKPMEFENFHIKLTTIAVPVIFVFVVLTALSPTTICTKMFTTTTFPKDYKNWYGASINIVYNITISVPVGLITILYIVKLCILKPNHNEKESANKAEKRKSFEKMIHMVVVGTFLCYVPFIVHKHMVVHSITKDCTQGLYGSTGKVIWTLERFVGNTKNNVALLCNTH